MEASLSPLLATRRRLLLFMPPSLRPSRGSRTPGSQRSPTATNTPSFPGGDSRLRVTGAWPLPPSLPAGERHSPPPLPTGRRRRRASARGGRRTKGPGLSPPLSPPPALTDLTLSLERWGDRGRVPPTPIHLRKGRWNQNPSPVASVSGMGRGMRVGGGRDSQAHAYKGDRLVPGSVRGGGQW